MADDRMFTAAEALLVARNAQNLEHPGGTLLGLRTQPDRKSLRAFVEITAANELDVVRNSSAQGAR